jgi:SAM-dependent methyltransferase
LFENGAVRDSFLGHYDDLRGQVRMEIVRRHLSAVIDGSHRMRVLDIGCGDGRDCRWLADQGHSVIGLDPASAMIEQACKEHAGQAKGSLLFAQGDVETALADYGPGQFDLVLSHGVIMYQDDPAAFLARHVELARDGGKLSLLAKNADALAFRAAREASVDEAIRVLDDSNSIGHLGLATGAQTIQELSDFGFAAGATVYSWAGVRLFSDAPSDPVIEAKPDKIIELEWMAARRDPHRRTAALLHVLYLRGVDLSLLPA